MPWHVKVSYGPGAPCWATSTLPDTSALCLDETFLILVKIVFQTPDQWPYISRGLSCWLLAFTLSFVILVLLTSKPFQFPNSRLLGKLLPTTPWHSHCLCDHSHLPRLLLPYGICLPYYSGSERFGAFHSPSLALGLVCFLCNQNSTSHFSDSGHFFLKNLSLLALTQLL